MIVLPSVSYMPYSQQFMRSNLVLIEFEDEYLASVDLMQS